MANLLAEQVVGEGRGGAGRGGGVGGGGTVCVYLIGWLARHSIITAAGADDWARYETMRQPRQFVVNGAVLSKSNLRAM